MDTGAIATNQSRSDGPWRGELSRHHSEREICEIVWLVSSEHLYNASNIGLNIGSDDLCQIGDAPVTGA